MANSSESHSNVGTAGEELASFESRAEVYVSYFEAELGDITKDPDIQLGLRFVDLNLLRSGKMTMIVPPVDRGAHPKLLTTSLIMNEAFGENDIRRVLVSYENDEQVVTTRDWFVNLTVGTCCVLESHNSLAANPTAVNGPVIGNNPDYTKVVLTEGAEYVEDIKRILPNAMDSDPSVISDFMADTHLFIGGNSSTIDSEDESAYQRIVTPDPNSH